MGYLIPSSPHVENKERSDKPAGRSNGRCGEYLLRFGQEEELLLRGRRCWVELVCYV